MSLIVVFVLSCCFVEVALNPLFVVERRVEALSDRVHRDERKEESLGKGICLYLRDMNIQVFLRR